MEEGDLRSGETEQWVVVVIGRGAEDRGDFLVMDRK